MARGKFDIDPESLERAAQAVRELDKSPNAKLILKTLIAEQEAKIEEKRAAFKSAEIEKARVEQEERRKTIDKDRQARKADAEYRDQLERKRQRDFLLEKEDSNDRIMKRNEEATKRQEEMKMKTMAFELEKKAEYDKKRYEQKGVMLAKVKRETHDLHQKDILLKEQERRKTLNDLFATNLKTLGLGMQTLLSDYEKMINLAILTGMLTLSYHGIKSAIGLGTRFLEARFARPRLIRETSRLTYKNFYEWPLRLTKGSFQNFFHKPSIFHGLIVSEQLQEQLGVLVYSIQNRSKNVAPFRNMMFYGPPGTGKTLFAKKLALQSGLDYAIMAGADVAPLGSNVVEELHKVFDWANTSRKGMILFIDESDAYLRKREGQLSENLRNSIETFLYRTGTPSKNFFFVLATNAPQDLDDAVHDRIDQALEFDLPELKQRKELIYYYLVHYCEPKTSYREKLKEIIRRPTSVFQPKKYVKLKTIDSEIIDRLAMQTEGFSARQIEKFVVSCVDEAFCLENPVLTEELMWKTLARVKVQYGRRLEWNSKQSTK